MSPSPDAMADAMAPRYCEEPWYFGADAFPPAVVGPDPRAPAPARSTTPGEIDFLTVHGDGVGAQYSTYWLNGGEELDYEILASLPLDQEGAATWRCMLLVDGVVHTSRDGAVQTDLVFTDGLGSVRWVLEAGELSPGAHTVSFVCDDGVRITPIRQVTVFQDQHLPWSPLSASPGGTPSAAIDERIRNVLNRDDGQPIHGFERPDASGAMRLTIALQPFDDRLVECGGASWTAFLAFLDGLPVPFDGVPGGVLFAEVLPGERVSFDVDLVGLPTEGAHRLELVQVDGLRSAASDLRDGLTIAGFRVPIRHAVMLWE